MYNRQAFWNTDFQKFRKVRLFYLYKNSFFVTVKGCSFLKHWRYLKCDWNVFQFLRSEVWTFVVFRHALAGQDLDEGDQLQPVGELRLQVVDLKENWNVVSFLTLFNDNIGSNLNWNLKLGTNLTVNIEDCNGKLYIWGYSNNTWHYFGTFLTHPPPCDIFLFKLLIFRPKLL